MRVLAKELQLVFGPSFYTLEMGAFRMCDLFIIIVSSENVEIPSSLCL